MLPASTPEVPGGHPGTEEICTFVKSGLFCMNSRKRPTPLMLLAEAGIVSTFCSACIPEIQTSW